MKMVPKTFWLRKLSSPVPAWFWLSSCVVRTLWKGTELTEKTNEDKAKKQRNFVEENISCLWSRNTCFNKEIGQS